MSRSIMLTAALLAALSSQPAQAADDGAWSHAGSWIIAMDPGDNCAMLDSFSDGWLFGVGYSVDRHPVGMIIGTLPYKVGDQPALSWEIGGVAYSGGENIVAEVEAGTRVSAGMGDDFIDRVAAATSIQIYDDDTGKKVVGFNLRGTAAAVSELRRCLGELVKEDKGSRQPAVDEPVPLNLATLITEDDYPESAQRAGAGGRTGVALTITAHGLVSDCAIVASSGNVDLDDAACRIMRDRARFRPAIDAANNGTEGRFQTGVVWTLPED